MPVVGAEAWRIMRDYNRMVVSGVLVEDSTTGVVTRSIFGPPMVWYSITPHDHRRFIKGAKLLSELHFAMGAERVLLPFAGVHEVSSMDEVRALDERNLPIPGLELDQRPPDGDSAHGEPCREFGHEAHR